METIKKTRKPVAAPVDQEPTFRQRVAVLNDTLNYGTETYKMPDDVAEWAFINAIPHAGHYFKNKAWPCGKILCMDCYHTFTQIDNDVRLSYKGDTLTGEAVCPHCGARLSIIKTRRITSHSYNVFGFHHIINGIDVLRVFECHLYRNKNHDKESKIIYDKKSIFRKWYEVLRVWKDTGTGEEFVTLRGRNSYFSNPSIFSGTELKIRDVDFSTYRNDYLYSPYINPVNVAPMTAATEIDIRYIMPVFQAITWVLKSKSNFSLILSSIRKYPMVESLVKGGFTKEAAFVANTVNIFQDSTKFLNKYYSVGVNEFLNVLRLCMKNDYHIKDIPMYYDYLLDLKMLGKDMTNAYYICPDDVAAAHTATTAKIQKIEEANFEEEFRKLQPAYEKTHGAYFGIAFNEPKEGLTFHVISSVFEMKMEGKRMHHCVGGYYNRNGSLIISCRYPDGRRLATIEVSLYNFNIVQTRGKCNTEPQHRKLIDKTIMDHMPEIKAIAKAEKEKAKKAEKEAAKQTKAAAKAESVAEAEAAQEEAAPCRMAMMMGVR